MQGDEKIDEFLLNIIFEQVHYKLEILIHFHLIKKMSQEQRL